MYLSFRTVRDMTDKETVKTNQIKRPQKVINPKKEVKLLLYMIMEVKKYNQIKMSTIA
jgi:hypothetical protein